MRPEAEPETVWEGKYLQVRKLGTWEWVARTRGVTAAVMLAIDDGPFGEAQDRHVILVEQYRVPLGAMSLELPAGLVGDEEEGEEIAVHRVKLADVHAFVEARRRDGVAIDVKILLLLASSFVR